MMHSLFKSSSLTRSKSQQERRDNERKLSDVNGHKEAEKDVGYDINNDHHDDNHENDTEGEKYYVGGTHTERRHIESDTYDGGQERDTNVEYDDDEEEEEEDKEENEEEEDTHQHLYNNQEEEADPQRQLFGFANDDDDDDDYDHDHDDDIDEDGGQGNAYVAETVAIPCYSLKHQEFDIEKINMDNIQHLWSANNNQQDHHNNKTKEVCSELMRISASMTSKA